MFIDFSLFFNILYVVNLINGQFFITFFNLFLISVFLLSTFDEKRLVEINIPGVVTGIILVGLGICGVIFGVVSITKNVTPINLNNPCTFLDQLSINDRMREIQKCHRIFKETRILEIIETLLNESTVYNLNFSIDSINVLKNNLWYNSANSNTLLNGLQFYGNFAHCFDLLQHYDLLLSKYNSLTFVEKTYFRCVFSNTYGISFEDFIRYIQEFKVEFFRLEEFKRNKVE